MVLGHPATVPNIFISSDNAVRATSQTLTLQRSPPLAPCISGAATGNPASLWLGVRSLALLAEVWVMRWGVVAIASTSSALGLPILLLPGLRRMGFGVEMGAALPLNDSGWKPKLLMRLRKSEALREGSVGVPPISEPKLYRPTDGAPGGSKRLHSQRLKSCSYRCSFWLWLIRHAIQKFSMRTRSPAEPKLLRHGL